HHDVFGFASQQSAGGRALSTTTHHDKIEGLRFPDVIERSRDIDPFYQYRRYFDSGCIQRGGEPVKGLALPCLVFFYSRGSFVQVHVESAALDAARASCNVSR